MSNYFNPEIETMPVEEIKKLQSKRLVEQIKHVYKNVEFYRNKMDEAGVKPEDIRGIEDLSKLPFINKDDLRDQYPYGFLAVPLEDCVRIQSTSGTTGRRVVAFYTMEDIHIWDTCCARAIVAAGGTKEDVAYVIGKHRETDSVYDGSWLHNSLLYSLICCLSGRKHKRNGRKGSHKAQGRYIRG